MSEAIETIFEMKRRHNKERIDLVTNAIRLSGSVREAARRLGIDRAVLHRELREHGVLSKKQLDILEWMKGGDRALHRQIRDTTRFGFYEDGKFHYLCSRQTVEALVRSGEVEWMDDLPRARAMIVLPRAAKPKTT